MLTLCYCEKCGRFVLLELDKGEHICDCCDNIVKLVPEEYLASRFSIKKDLEEEFIEKYIKPSPEFDQYLFDHREEILSQKNVEFNRAMSVVDNARAGKSVGKTPSVTCPYCKSTNVSKISTLGRSISVGLFGLASGKVGKQWHCNGCNSDF